MDINVVYGFTIKTETWQKHVKNFHFRFKQSKTRQKRGKGLCTAEIVLIINIYQGCS